MLSNDKHALPLMIAVFLVSSSLLPGELEISPCMPSLELSVARWCRASMAERKGPTCLSRARGSWLPPGNDAKYSLSFFDPLFVHNDQPYRNGLRRIPTCVSTHAWWVCV